MSQQNPEESQELAQILSRVNAVMRHGNAENQQQQEPAVADETIPLLTEVYEGEPVEFSARLIPEFPILDEVAQEPAAVTPAQVSIPAEILEALLAEMTPRIQSAVHQAVQQHLENAEAMLSLKLETELIQSLRERLQAYQQ